MASYSVSDNPILDYNYSYLTGSAVSSIATEHGLYQYSYDQAYRLTSAISPTFPLEQFHYDENGNRYPGQDTLACSSEPAVSDGVYQTPLAAGHPRKRSVSESDSSPFFEDSGRDGEYLYNENGAVLEGDSASYEYDADGNRISKTDAGGTTLYIHDESDRLVRVERPAGNVIASYGYDPDGSRIWKEVNGERTWFYTTLNGLAAEFNANGETVRSYLYHPRSRSGTSPLALRDSGGFNYYHKDHLGTPRKLTRANGSVSWSAQYKAFGEAQVDVAGIAQPLRLPGQYYDSETNLHQNLMRDYDPALGAYIQQDPLGARGGFGRYQYAHGNPLAMIDPTGEMSLGEMWDWLDEAIDGIDPFEDFVEPTYEWLDPFADDWIPYWECIDYYGNQCYSDCMQYHLVLSLAGAGGGLLAGKALQKLGPRGLRELARLLNKSPNKKLMLPSPRDHLLGSITDGKLKRIISELYRKGAKYGNGSTADAIRHELATGNLLSKKGHFEKGIGYRTALMRELRSGRLNARDRQIVKDVLTDLQNAMSGF